MVHDVGSGTRSCQAVESGASCYLLAHALYKGALFLLVGAVDHAAHTRDVRELGGLWRRMPVTALIAVVAALSMIGVLPLFGFVAKELYVEAVLDAPMARDLLIGISVASSMLVTAGAGLVALGPFFGKLTEKAGHAHEAPFALWFGPAVLAAGGVALGLDLENLALPLLLPAVAVTLNQAVEWKLILWHGFTVPLAVSLAILAGGVFLYAVRDGLRRRLPIPAWALRWGPESWYGRSVEGVNWLARRQTALFQSGYLRIYVLTTVGSMVALVAVAAARLLLEVQEARTAPLGLRAHEAIAAGLVLAAALVAVASRSRLKTVAALGVVGYSVSWIYSLFGAPDLAMTQIVVESLTVILFVLSFRHLPDFRRASPRRSRWRDATVALAAGGLMTGLLLVVMRVPHHPVISGYYAEQSVSLAHARNVVNAILVDFRALDTLGEIAVLATAGVGVYALLRLNTLKDAP
jgi:multicomponent Na+:H+ antiporter subunit A